MIFGMTSENLRKMGYEVYEYTEAEFVLNGRPEKFIFNMARKKSTINCLKQFERDGAMVINSGFGVENCTRAAMTRILMENEISHPASIIVDVTEDPTCKLVEMKADAFWIKRGDSQAIHSEDVTYARNIQEVKSILQEFAFRDIPNAVINEHLIGDLVKFYGVADTDFFYWFYPFDHSHSKFGLEKINGKAHEFLFDTDALKKECDKAGEILGVKVYGGDCVVAKNGLFKIIDFNDWPSFAPCRNEAAPKIAECIHKQIIKNNWNNK
jgi:glutathione synthase/RimK-type ligase-like ATP-grasp enzyme